MFMSSDLLIIKINSIVDKYGNNANCSKLNFTGFIGGIINMNNISNG